MIKQNEITFLMEELICYAKCHLGLDEHDENYTRNALMATLKITTPSIKFPSVTSISQMTVPDIIINHIVEYALQENITQEDEKELFETFILGLVSPMPSAVINKFKKIADEDSSDSACKYLYDFCIKNNYIKKSKISKNIKFTHKDKNNEMMLTINLSRPEKDNKDVEKQSKAQSTDYPKCMLCAENVGFSGNKNYPSKQTLRTIPVTLGGQEFFMQFSPYVYFEEHCIVISKEHTPMKIDKTTFEKLSDFVDAFPHYFIGSNSSLPIIGGSILSHEHFQGGRELLPLQKCGPLKALKHDDFSDVEFSLVDWHTTTLRVKSDNKESFVNACNHIFSVWQNYNNKSCMITSKNGSTFHNSVTPIVRLEKGVYIADLILRNNSISEEFPNGIFHTDSKYYNIKSESLGIIEVLGLFVLPARLQADIAKIKEFVTGQKKFSPKVYKNEEHEMANHFYLIKEIIKEFTDELSPEDADIIILEAIAKNCIKILETSSVFKKDETGTTGIAHFFGKCDLKEA